MNGWRDGGESESVAGEKALNPYLLSPGLNDTDDKEI